MKTTFTFSILIGFSLFIYSCKHDNNSGNIASQNELADTADSQKQIASMLDSFNLAAARADYDQYFNYFTETATFIGTDAAENWDKKAFMAWARPYFDKKTTWQFKSLDRHIYLGKSADIAWFDELLNTQMKICRGSGVVVKENYKWKVQQYVLSVTIPNSDIDAIIKIKAPTEDSMINKLSGK